MLSIVPLLKGGGLFETGAGGSAPKHVQQFVAEGHLRWDSLGEYLAMAVALETYADNYNNEKARTLGETLNEATGKLLNNTKSPSRTVNEIDNRGSSYYIAQYWAEALAKRDPSFKPLAEELVKNEEVIMKDLIDCQGKPVDIGGYFKPCPEKCEKAMRPSSIFNGLIDDIPSEGPVSDEMALKLIHGYLACVSYVDAQIGELISKLHKTGQYDNTIIVLWGDHGFHLGDKHLFGKHTNYEEATRSPLIIANHGLDSGSMSYAPANLIDLFPTLCELTGLATPDGLDGVSLVPVLEDASADVQEYAASLYPIDGYMGIAIRTQSYRYVAWYKGWPESGWCGKRYKSVPEFIELYDYTKDPLETKNLSGQAEYEEIEARLVRLSKEHVTYTQGKQFRN